MKDLKFTPISGLDLTASRIEDIMSLDRANMTSILQAAGINFPEEKRRLGLAHPSLRIILALSREDKLLGYVDYRDDLNNRENLYLSSIQIESTCRGGLIFRELVAQLIIELRTMNFKQISTHVQKTNTRMIKIFKKLGFQVNESASATWEVFGKNELLFDSSISKIFRL